MNWHVSVNLSNIRVLGPHLRLGERAIFVEQPLFYVQGWRRVQRWQTTQATLPSAWTASRAGRVTRGEGGVGTVTGEAWQELTRK